MKRQILISSLILLFIQNFVSARTFYVPSRDYPTIQSAVTAAVNGDVVVVAPNPNPRYPVSYSGTGNVNIDFGGKAITIKSTIDPNNPNPAIIAATIIDCQGTKDDPHRAFWFHNHEGNNSKVLGFTIRNGYTRGPKGADGTPGYIGFPVSLFVPIPRGTDPNASPPYALDGASASGDGYGGAILCEAASSPTIKYCVVKNCAVTGAQGGRGADGLSGTWFHFLLSDIDPCTGEIDVNAVLTSNPDGQWGGRGGAGNGNGYGGAVACRGGSSPIISDCTISDNFARGGCGGDGGNGGNAEGDPPDYAGGYESFGGNAGDSNGDGMGGAIYAENGSSPIIASCTFSDDIATTGARAVGGSAGQGNTIPDNEGGPATDGADGVVISTGGIAGGAAYYNNPSSANANFTNCTFTGNKAYEAHINPFLGEDFLAYTVGGALYSKKNNTVNLNSCNFTGNLGGAVYCGSGCVVNINNTYDPNRSCLFSDNSETANGGAVYIEAGGTANLRNCIFGGNSAYDDGGALECRSNATLTSCSFGGNRADSDNDGYGYGGAMDAYRFGTTLVVDFNSCSFSGNQAIYGGGFSSENFHNTKFTNCYFVGNTAHDGGGLDLVNGDFFVTGGAVKGNNATDGDGGGFDCWYTKAEIRNCTIRDNFADGNYPAGGDGGAINFYGGASPQTVFNCLITGNSAAVDGGAIFCSNATPGIGNCTFSGNLAGGYGGAIFSDWSSSPQITDCIFEGCNGHAIHEEDYGGNAIVRYSLFYNNPNGEYYDSVTHLVYTGAGQVGSIPGGVANLYGNPLFVAGPLGNFYLNQTSSPAVLNGGSDTAANLGLNTYTTDPNNTTDSGQVDRGYHYPISTSVQKFNLTASVVGGHGSIAPTSGPYYAGTVVTLTATPNTGWLVKAWSGTDNDSSTATTNTVIMNFNRTVTVEFEQPRTLIVAVGGGGEGYYPTIQDAVSDANNGDTIVVYPGIYYGGYESVSIYIDESITIRSLHPDDPCCAAATVIDGYLRSPFEEGYTNLGVTFGSNTDANTILNGFTIQNCGGRWGGRRDGERAPQNHPNGYDGGMGAGAAIRVASGGGPIIKNCIIRDNVVIGGYAGNGVAATGPPDNLNAGRGGWGGAAYGGAVYCSVNSSPTFINCRIIDNEARGGDGGDGGNEVFPGGYANYGGNWSMRGTPEYPVYDIDPYSSNITYVTDGNLWGIWGYIGDYRWYSGYGGGVFIDEGSNVTFTHCTISGNLTQGGMSGQGGEQAPVPRPEEPLIPYEIPSFGGGVYCAADSTVTFTGCTITDNISSEPNVTPNNRIDPYLGHGGGVCAEDTATLKFTNCTFSENDADAGGGLLFADANLVISDCNFTFNSAFQGGGLFGEHGPATIRHSNFTNNIASSEANDPNVVILGDGGGLHLWATDANIIDCNISSNQAEASGGGVFFGGEGAPSLTNCLLTNNAAGRDGGGVSTNIFSQLTISNCTIADNTSLEYGGGVYCSYNSYVNIINSIIWNNIGIYGSQLAITTSFEYDPSPSAMRVTYTDIGPRYDPNTFTVPIFDDSFGGSSPSGGPNTVLVDGQNIYGQFDAGQGQVKIIVSMPEPAELMAATDWDSPESVAELRAEIASRRSAVLSTLTPSEFSLRHSYENIAGFSGEITRTGLEKLLSDPRVAHIEPVRQVCPVLRQAIPLANALGARQVYNGAGAAIAIVDTGIDYRHPMLGGGGFPNSKVIGGYDTGNNDNDPLPVGEAHGTCCAGIAAGNLGTVGDYIGGVAPGAKLYALKASPDNAGYFLTDAELAAWDWCITHRNDNLNNPIKVMSNSWGMTGTPFNDRGAADAYSPAHTALVETAVAAGITVLAASGNDGFAGQGISWPAAMSKVISVGAVYDTTDQVTGYSNTAEILDILAPADPIYTTDIIGAEGYASGNYYPSFNGTSAACPFAAGCVADIQTAARAKLGRYLAPVEVKSLLVIAGNPVTDTKVAITKPRVNLGNAIAGLEMSPIYIEKGCELNGWEAPDTNNYWGWDPNRWPNSHNIEENPYFVAGYYLSQVVAGQLINSKCVDTGSDTAANLGMDEYTTRTDGMFDVDIVDMGYHYLVAAWVDSCRLCELFHDGIINFEDFAVLASNWLSEDCSWGNDWCEHADVTFDGYVNFKDVLLFTECWLTEDTETPFPNPSEWEVEPYSGSTTSITMTARTAVDRWGGTVEYYFKCVSGGGNDSGWQSDSNYTDSNLVSGVEYGYKVRARDASEQIPNDGTGQPGNKTGWSPIRYAVVGEVPPPPEDHNPPQPDRMTWATVPYATSSTSIAMVATTATDDTAGVEYYFEDFNSPTVNSGWQSSPSWVDTTCGPNTTYTYRVKARDTSTWHNETGWSELRSATTPAGGGPPPPPNQAPGPVAWEVTPFQTGSGMNAYANMTAAEATDPEGNNPVQYYFVCVSIPSYNSGWTTNRVWNNYPIGRAGQFLYFHFRVRDSLGNTSSWSTSLPCY
jgi:hypothetical protein